MDIIIHYVNPGEAVCAAAQGRPMWLPYGAEKRTQAITPGCVAIPLAEGDSLLRDLDIRPLAHIRLSIIDPRSTYSR